MIKPLYSPQPDRPMRVAGFMSGSGTNLVKIIERERELASLPGGSPYEVVVVFTDNPASNASRLCRTYGIPLVVEDIMAFYRSRGHTTKRDLSLRPDFDRRILEALGPYAVDAVVLAGYMSIVTRPLLEAFPGRIINVHPADLRIEEAGRRKYTGDDAVGDAILAGEPEIRATTHIVREEVDGGEILMVSGPVQVELPEGVRREDLAGPGQRELRERLTDEHQERLKRHGDWVILPRTLEWLARGRFGLDEAGRLCLDGRPVEDLEYRGEA